MLAAMQKGSFEISIYCAWCGSAASGIPNSRLRRKQVGPSRSSIRLIASGDSVQPLRVREQPHDKVTVQRGRELEFANPVCHIAVSLRRGISRLESQCQSASRQQYGSNNQSVVCSTSLHQNERRRTKSCNRQRSRQLARGWAWPNVVARFQLQCTTPHRRASARYPVR